MIIIRVYAKINRRRTKKQKILSEKKNSRAASSSGSILEVQQRLLKDRDDGLVADIISSRVDLIDRFAAEDHEPGASLTLYRDGEGKRWVPGIGERVVKGLYESLGQEVPPELEADDPDVQHELGLLRHYGFEWPSTLVWYVETNRTPITTRIQLSPELAIERVTTFTWENHSKEVTGKDSVHKLVRTEPSPETVGTVVNDFLHNRYGRRAAANK